MKRTLLAVGLMLMAGAAGADKWVAFGAQTGGLLDSQLSSIAYFHEPFTKKDRGHILVWWKVVYEKPQTRGQVSFDTAEDYVDLDCKESTIRYLEQDYYSDGTSVASVDPPASWPKAFSYIPPESLGAMLEARVCPK